MNTTFQLHAKENITLNNSSIMINDFELRRHDTYEIYELNLKGKLRKDLMLEAALQDSWANVVCSPVSALLSLGKLALGAEGQTQQELFQAIGVSRSNDISSFKKLVRDLQFLPGVDLTVATRIYVPDEVEVLTKFEQEATDIFGSGVEKISFSNPTAAADEINGWVSRETKGTISTLIDPSDIKKTTSMFIVNAIRFKGRWKDTFNKVKVDDFYAPTGIKKTQMMNRVGRYNYAKSSVLRAQVINIPYVESKSSLIIVLPLEKSDLPFLINQLKLYPTLINQALVTLQQKMVNLTIPKFKITSTLDLKKLYNKTGLNEIFKAKSGVNGIVKDEELHISNAIQKVVIEVHETGTDAAYSYIARQGSALTTTRPEIFNANHPFLFYLITNKEPLFGGTFVEP